MYFLLFNKPVHITAVFIFLAAFSIGITAAVALFPAENKAEKIRRAAFCALMCYSVLLFTLVFLPVCDAAGKLSVTAAERFSFEISFRKLFSHRVFLLNTAVNFALFFIFGALVSMQISLKCRFLRAFVFCLAVSVYIEIIQLFIPTRASDACDILINALGAACGVPLGMLFVPKANAPQKSRVRQ